jgi:hypothetical protein
MSAITLSNYHQSVPLYPTREILGANPYALRFVTGKIQQNQDVSLDANNAYLLPIGSIVGLASSGTNSGYYVLWNSTAADGSQTPVGVLFESMDTSQGVQPATIMTGGSVLQDKLLAASGTTIPPAGTILTGTEIQLEASVVPGAPF